MAGAALAAVPIIIIFLIFQKYFTKGIAMGAVKAVSYTHLDVYKRQLFSVSVQLQKNAARLPECPAAERHLCF